MSYQRPRFVREESWRYKRVKEPWRSGRGKTSRVRRGRKGWPLRVKIGYSRPKATKGMHPSGLKEVLVWRPKDLEGLDPKTHVARIAHTVGENKRVLILDEAKKRNIRILNPRLKRAAEPGAVPGAVAEPAPEGPPPEPKEEVAEPPAKEHKRKRAKKAAKRKETRK